jgi:hypothetical protein
MTLLRLTELLRSTDPQKRRRGWLDVADRAVGAERAGQQELWATVAPFAGREESAGATAAMVSALGILAITEAQETVLAERASPDPRVREAVARALPFVVGNPPAREAVAALVGLSADDDPDVRYWATSGLGSLLEVDGPAIRHALVVRLDDTDAHTRAEAILGLAWRRDGRAVALLLAELERGAGGDAVLRGAAYLGDARLLSSLRALEGTRDVDSDLLLRAIDRCDPVQLAELDAITDRLVAQLDAAFADAIGGARLLRATVGDRGAMDDGDPTFEIEWLAADGTRHDATYDLRALLFDRSRGSSFLAAKLVVEDARSAAELDFKST